MSVGAFFLIKQIFIFTPLELLGHLMLLTHQIRRKILLMLQ